MGRDGNAARGQELFNNEQRLACAKCHSVDGSSGKAGPDLFAAGDKFPRRELIRAVLEPSAEIAVGYGTTIVETKSGEEFQGILKQSTADALELIGADDKRVRIATRDIKEQRGSTVSLMPEGLQAGLSRQEFSDLIEYLVTLKQPETALTSNRGMPVNIPELARPIAVRPLFAEQTRFPHAFVQKPGDVRYGLVWFGPIARFQQHVRRCASNGKDLAAGKERHQRNEDALRRRGQEHLQRTRAERPARFGVPSEVSRESQILSQASGLRGRQDRDDSCRAPGFAGFAHGLGTAFSTIVESREHNAGPQRRLHWVWAGWFSLHRDGRHWPAARPARPRPGFDDASWQDSAHRCGPRRRWTPLRDSARTIRFAIAPTRGPEIWAYGFREPWRFSFDPLTRDLWVGDVGQDRVEEVAIVRRGENHGWNVYEGFEPFSNRYRKEGATYVPPVFAYRRKYGNSITGGYVYRGDKRSSFYGVYICGDYTSHRVFGIKQRDRVLKVIRQIGIAPQGIASFAQDERGEIYLVGYEGMVYQLDFTGTNFDDEMKTNSIKP
jgi:putative heme-binding domain-containing protein